MRYIIAVVLFTVCTQYVSARLGGEPSYESTRKLLGKVENGQTNSALAQLFCEAYGRRTTLIRALDDPDPEVQANALLIIDYVALPELNAAFETWQKSIQGTDRSYLRRKILPLDPKYGESTFEGSPESVTRRYLFSNEPGSYREIARNSEAHTVLVEVILGGTFTEGWHVVLRQEGDHWRPIVKTVRWQS